MPKTKTSYDDATRAAFTNAALEARKEGKSWSDVYAAAAGSGYEGTLGGIKQFLLKAKAKAAESPAVTPETPAAEAVPMPVPEKKAEKKKTKAKAKAAKSSGKKQRILYDAATTEAILTAVTEARKNGDWKAAHAAATGAGYKGGLGGLQQFVANKIGAPKATAAKARKAPKAPKATKVPKAPKAAKAPAVKKGKRGRKAKAPAAKAAAAPVIVANFALESIPEAVRGDFAGWVVSKIEKEFKHSVADKNVDQATALYLDIVNAQTALDAKIAALKSL